MDGVRSLYTNISIHRNSRASISRLPEEILALVFRQVLVQYEAESLVRTIDAMDKKLAPRPLLAITHVCSRWRRVAIASPFLWTHINMRNDDLIQLFASRSQNAAVSVFCKVKRSSASDDISPRQIGRAHV